MIDSVVDEAPEVGDAVDDEELIEVVIGAVVEEDDDPVVEDVADDVVDEIADEVPVVDRTDGVIAVVDDI